MRRASVLGNAALHMPGCGICPVSHHLAAAKAGDAVLGVQIPPTAKKLRELMHMGQFLQSHALHFFHLASPDLLLGFDADPAKRNVVGLIAENRNWRQGCDATQARSTDHRDARREESTSTFAIPGGVNRALTHAQQEEILKQIDGAIADVQLAVGIIKDYLEKNGRSLHFRLIRLRLHGLTDDDGNLDLYDGTLR